VNHENPFILKRLDSREKFQGLIELRIGSKMWSKLKSNSKNEIDQQKQNMNQLFGKFKKDPKEPESKINGVW
jgi:hypothetical protein